MLLLTPDAQHDAFRELSLRYGWHKETVHVNISERRRRAEQDKVFFYQTYFPQNVKSPFSAKHQVLFDMCEIRDTFVAISAFRDWGKSTIASYLDWFHKACYGKIHVSGFGSNNQTLALQFAKAIKGFLEDPPPESDAFREDFPELVGSVEGTQVRFTTRTGIKVFAIGAGMSPRGFIDFRKGERIDWFNLDDLETDASANSAGQSEDILQWIFKSVYPAMRAPTHGGYYLRFIGTPITPVSVMTRVLGDKEKYPHRIRIPIYDENGLPAWPEVFNEEGIQKIRAETTLSAWHSEYLLQPISSETQIFREDWVKHWKELPPETSFIRTVAVSDPSGTNTKKSDYKAIVVASFCMTDARVYIRHVYCRRATVGEYLHALQQIQQLYGCPIFIEDNGIKDFLGAAVSTYEHDHACHLNASFFTQTKNKEQRIQGALESPFERDLIRLPPLTHSDTRLFRDQLLAFPHGLHDDAIDAGAEAYGRACRDGSDAIPTGGEDFQTGLPATSRWL